MVDNARNRLCSIEAIGLHLPGYCGSDDRCAERRTTPSRPADERRLEVRVHEVLEMSADDVNTRRTSPYPRPVVGELRRSLGPDCADPDHVGKCGGISSSTRGIVAGRGDDDISLCLGAAYR